MEKIKIFVFNHFKWLFPLAVLLAVITATLTLKHDQCLANGQSPKSMLSFQQSYRQKSTDSIIKKWQEDTCYCALANSQSKPCNNNSQCLKAIVYAKKSIKADYGFIVAYTLLLLLLLMRLNCYRPFNHFFNAQKDIDTPAPLWAALVTRIMMFFVLAAAVFDFAENFLMLRLLDHIPATTDEIDSRAAVFGIFSMIKMSLLGIVIVYIFIRASVWLTGFILKTAGLLWRFRIAVASLLLLGLPIFLTDQGQDLLANIINTHWGPVELFITLSILALLNWHLPKLYYGTENMKLTVKRTREAGRENFHVKHIVTRNWDTPENNSLPAENNYERKAGRMLGVLTFLIPACAISNALDAFKADHFFRFISPIALLVVLGLLFYFAIRYDLLEKLTQYIEKNNDKLPGKAAYFAVILFLAAAVIMIILPAFNNQSSPQKMTRLQVNLILLAILFLLFTHYRKRGLLVLLFSRNRLNIFIWGGAALCISVFLAFNISPMALQWVNNSLGFRLEPVPLLISAIVFHTVLFSVLLLLGRKFKADLISILLVGGLVITLSGSNNFHTVRHLAQDKSVPADSMNSFRNYLKEWLLYREKEIEKFDTSGGRRYPFFLVNSYGGGIRASAWTSMLLTRIDQQLSQKTMLFGDSLAPRHFSHYTFAVSGISGGTVGLGLNTAIMYRQLREDSGKLQLPGKDEWMEFYQADFLSPVTTVLLGRDMLASVLGVDAWQDRAAIMERVWEKQARPFGPFDEGFRNIWNRSAPNVRYEIPLLFANTYHAERGVQGILAPVTLDSADFPSSSLLNNLSLVRQQDLRLSTVSFISARFPYISPSARFDYAHHYIDGGAKEYSGSGTLYNVLMLIEKIKKEDTLVARLMNKMRICHFNIKNYLPSEEIEILNNPFEVTLPLKALYQGGYGNTEEAILRMEQAVGKPNDFMVQPRLEYLFGDDCKKRYSPVLPLGWKISKDALRRMWESVDMEERDNKSAFSRLLQVFE